MISASKDTDLQYNILNDSNNYTHISQYHRNYTALYQSIPNSEEKNLLG